jgi:hypothetical protein
MLEAPIVTDHEGSPSAVRVVVSADGRLAAIVEPTRVVVVRLAGLVTEAEIGIEGGADANDVAFAGTPGRLIVLAHSHARTCLHLIEPTGPRQLGELQFRMPTRIVAVSGRHVLLANSVSTALVDVFNDELVAIQLRSRLVISAAGAFGPDRFILSARGVFEECDARTGAPARRFRFNEPVTAQHLGGNQRRIWSILRSRSGQIDVLSLVGGRQPEHILLPEPARRVAADAEHDLLLVIGSQTGGGFVVDLGRRTVKVLDHGRIDDAVWQGGTAAIVLAAAGRPLAVVPWSTVDIRGMDEGAKLGNSGGRDEAETRLRPSAEPAIRTSVARAASAPAERAATVSARRFAVAPAVPAAHGYASRAAPMPGSRPRPMTVAERLASWREHGRPSSADVALAAEEAVAPLPLAKAAIAMGWRGTLAAWSRSALSGNGGAVPVLAAGPLHGVAVRLGLDEELTRALGFVYGAHICGNDGVAPIDLAGVIGGCWDEALGGGHLATSGALVWRRSRIYLAAVVATALDELPPRTGTLVSGVIDTAGIVAVVAPRAIELFRVGVWAASIAGTLLVPGSNSERRPAHFLLEARARGVAPLVPLQWLDAPFSAVPDPAVLLIENEEELVGAAIPVIARWNALANELDLGERGRAH